MDICLPEVLMSVQRSDFQIGFKETLQVSRGASVVTIWTQSVDRDREAGTLGSASSTTKALFFLHDAYWSPAKGSM